MRALLVLACVLASAPLAAAAAESAQLDLNVGSNHLYQAAFPDLAVPHHGRDVTDAASGLLGEVPAVPSSSWTSRGLVIEHRLSSNRLFVPWPVNGDETRIDERNLYPLHLGDVRADLGSEADTARWLAGQAVPFFQVPPAPSTPDLAVGVSLREGRVSACVGACLDVPLALLGASLDGAPAFTRGFGAVAEAAPSGSGLLALPGHAPSASPLAPSLPADRAAPSPLAASAVAERPLLSGDSMLAVALAAGLLLLALPAALYSKIRRDSTLENDTRRAVYESVVAAPGLSIQDVARRSAISHSTAAYHLERLSSAGLVVATSDGNKVRYYRNGGRFTEAERRLLPVLENAETVRVLETVMGNPWTYRAEIAQQLGVTATTVNWHLKRLFGCGVLSERREGRNAYLFVERAPLAQGLAGLCDKLSPSPPREVASRLLALLQPAAQAGMSPPASPAPASAPGAAPMPLAPMRMARPAVPLGADADPLLR
jgi:predicted transcriptional regulator